MLRLAVLTELQLVMDKRTDRQTDRHWATTYTTLAQRRAVKQCTVTYNTTAYRGPIKK